MADNKNKNVELNDDDFEAATGGRKIIAGLDEKELADVASRVLEVSGVTPAVRSMAGKVGLGKGEDKKAEGKDKA